ncbi:MAG TPA: septum formation initiator family protein, partial [Blastocatellia bacterium]|nr:septum formation initiator family protein [Blastocatellia bacterium]
MRNRQRIESAESLKRALDRSKRAGDQEKRVPARTRAHYSTTDVLIGVVILIATAAAILLYYETSARLAGAQTRNQEAAARVEQLQIETERVENEIRKLERDPAFLESVARLELGFVRAGDVVIQLGSSAELRTRPVSTERVSSERVSSERVS